MCKICARKDLKTNPTNNIDLELTRVTSLAEEEQIVLDKDPNNIAMTDKPEKICSESRADPGDLVARSSLSMEDLEVLIDLLGDLEEGDADEGDGGISPDLLGFVPGLSGKSAPTQFVAPTGESLVDGILSTSGWFGPTINYSFPSDGELEDPDGGETTAITDGTKEVVFRAIDADRGTAAQAGFTVEGFTNLNVVQTIADDANLRFVQTSSVPEIGAFAFLPDGSSSSGDVYLGEGFDTPVPGDEAYLTILHEIGHALGLVHGHNDGDNPYGGLPVDLDTNEYSVMTYRTFVEEDVSEGPGDASEDLGFAQTYMMADIAALQHIYGADFETNADDTVYKWDPDSGNTLVNGEVGIEPGANRIYATIWDGGGIDTYDLSSYETDLRLNLSAGESSTFSDVQTARIGAGNVARGNIFNALMYKEDTRSLIENATGGSGDDSITGNQTDNVLTSNAGDDVLDGGDGRDTLIGGEGDDQLTGGSGADQFVFLEEAGGDSGRDIITDFNVDEDFISINGGWSVAILLDDELYPDAIKNIDGGAEITYHDDGSTIFLEGVLESQLSRTNFIITDADDTSDLLVEPDPDVADEPADADDDLVKADDDVAADDGGDVGADDPLVADDGGVDDVAGARSFDDAGSTQHLVGTDGKDVFVVSGKSSDFGWSKTLDGKGYVVWQDDRFDVLYDYEEIQFDDVTVELKKAGEEDGTYVDMKGVNEHLTGTDGVDTFIIDGNSSSYGWGKTEDGTGVVVWQGENFDILHNFERLQFNDGLVSIESDHLG